MTTTDPAFAARAELAQFLSRVGWTWMRTCCRFGRRVLDWRSDSSPDPPPLDRLTAGQARHLMELVREATEGK